MHHNSVYSLHLVWAHRCFLFLIIQNYTGNGYVRTIKKSIETFFATIPLSPHWLLASYEHTTILEINFLLFQKSYAISSRHNGLQFLECCRKQLLTFVAYSFVQQKVEWEQYTFKCSRSMQVWYIGWTRRFAFFLTKKMKHFCSALLFVFEPLRQTCRTPFLCF